MTLSSPDPEANENGFLLSFDKELLQLEVIHGFLSQSYWASGVPREVVARAVEHSLCVGVYAEGKQAAFARLITDYTTFGYLCDVFVLEPYRGQGLAKWMVQVLLAHPELQGLRRWMLATQDAHGLYAKLGFSPLPHPDYYLQRHTPPVYGLAAENKARS